MTSYTFFLLDCVDLLLNQLQGTVSRSSGEIHDEGVSFARRDDKKGLNITSAAVFIVGEMAGSGVLALPKAIVNSGE